MTDKELVEAMARTLARRASGLKMRHERNAWAETHWVDFVEDIRVLLAIARPIIEREARERALDEAAGVGRSAALSAILGDGNASQSADMVRSPSLPSRTSPMSDLTPELLAHLKALEKAATPGPVSVVEHERYPGAFFNLAGLSFPVTIVAYASDLSYDQSSQRRADANFLAVLRNAAPALIKAAEERDEFAVTVVNLAQQRDELRGAAKAGLRYVGASDAAMSEMRALLVRAGEAMEAISNRRYVGRGTVTESNAFAWFEKSNKELVEIYDAARDLAADIRRATQTTQEPT